MRDPVYFQLFRQTLVILAICITAVLICYFWIDRPVAFSVERHEINRIEIFRWLTYPPKLLQTFSPLLLVALAIRWAWAPPARWQMVLLVACISVIVAEEFRMGLGSLCGRYWPETWFDNNPSLIGDGTYGFHPFVTGDDTGSFPSGHAARILSFATVWWLAVPRSRIALIFVCSPLLVSTVAMNYHFVSDVIAGSVLGGLVAMYAVHLASVRMDFTGSPTCPSERSRDS